MKRRIKGKVVYQNIEGGFWSIISEEGEELRPQYMPVQLREEDKQIECVIFPTNAEFSIIMWGKEIIIYIFVV